VLLERSVALDPALGTHLDGSVGRPAFIDYFIDNRPGHAMDAGPWKAFVMEQVSRAVSSWSGHETSLASPTGQSDLATFVRLLQRESWLLGEAYVDFQAKIIGRATLKDRAEFITALLDLNPAILRQRPPPPAQAIEFACTYGKTHLIPLLSRIWPLPDDLPHAAAMGNLARVREWFDDSGAPALGRLERHYPRTSPHARQYDDLHWGAATAQHVLDSALAWSVINRHFDVAAFLLAHGADINTTWSSHEPASILHELVFHGNYESMQFLIDRGIDMTIRDYRWNATAQGWALHAAKNERMAKWLADAERLRGEGLTAPSRPE